MFPAKLGPTMLHREFAGRASLTGRLSFQAPLTPKRAPSLPVDHLPIGAIPGRTQIRRRHTRPTRLGISPFSGTPPGMFVQPYPCSLFVQQSAPLATTVSISPAGSRAPPAWETVSTPKPPDSMPRPDGLASRTRETRQTSARQQSCPSLQFVSRSAVDAVTLPADLSPLDALTETLSFDTGRRNWTND